MKKIDPALMEALKVEIETACAGTSYYVVHLDDEAELQENSEYAASCYGFKSLFFTNGEEAVAAIKSRQHEIALVISDLRMPGMDGFEFRNALLKYAPNIPFALLSAFVDRELAIKGMELKMSAIMAKPSDEEDFYNLVKKDALPRILALREERELKEGFVSDCESLIENAEEMLLHLEQDHSDEEALNRLFAIVHTLKGGSGFFEPKHLNHYSHRYEDILKGLQKRELPWSESVSLALFNGFDVMKELFAEFKSGVFLERDLEALYQIISLDNTSANVVNNSPTAVKDSESKTPAASAEKSKVREDVRVSVTLLDEFMQLSGEVTVIRNMLNKSVQALEKRFTGDREVASLGELLAELHKINSGVQAKITEIRKVPVKSVIKVLPRAVRDVSKLMGKEIDLQIIGEELRIDTSIAEVLNNSLLHIVKNSIDHGVEGPAERVAAGKSAKGQVIVTCTTVDEKVHVEIKDDGKGLNLKSIKNKLLKNGTHDQAQVDRMTPQQLYAMIFSSGFSTAAQVTEISGRGVGMSMVKDSVDAVGGEIQIESVEGKGAKFRLVLPVPKSVLISNCLTVRVGGLQFGVVRDDILRVLQLDAEQLKQSVYELQGATSLDFEGDLIALTNLSGLLEVTPDAKSIAQAAQKRIIVLSTPQDGRRVALEVDEILEVEDMVIKNIHTFLNTRQIYKGVTFLDDGRVGTILSTAGLMDAFAIAKPAEGAKTSKEQNAAEKIRAAIPSKSALLFSLSIPGFYGISQEKVFRIEEISQSHVKHSGLSRVLPYRGGILQIVSLESAFGKSPTARGEENTEIRLMVIEKDGRFIGVEVSEIVDMVKYSELNVDLAEPERGILGHFFVDDKTVCLLDVDAIISRVMNVTLDDVAAAGEAQIIEFSSSEKLAA